MKMKLYHGSEIIIKQPIYGKGKTNNDYGKGFYCTQTIDLAKEWACSSGSDGYANGYELDLDGLNILHLNGSGYSILNWLAILAKYRTYWQNRGISEQAKNYLQNNFYVDTSHYDVIIGYRADDSYFAFAQDFVSNAISLQQLSTAMYLGKLGEQVVLKSEKTFSQLSFEKAEYVSSEEYFVKKKARDESALKEYRSLKSYDNTKDIFMLDIMREEIKDGDIRLSGLL